ncbi:hypothetical protein GOBAR_AA21303 [Gossypium barbadense]|uniref:Vacuolar protein sorting-associated protein 26C n=1 Tax=Gossypium barbadense TaxID=3634 RepID=A0A2P5X7Q7_GOSBA|nr:hypothetical protein GOBAR_AA21303 [Gossypium barbadense]
MALPGLVKASIDAMSTKIDLSLSRPNRIYRPSEPLEGKIVVKSASSISHYGIRMALNGSVNLQVRGGSAGVIESFYGVVKPITILSRTLEIRPSGKIVSGTTEIPFSITLRNPKEDNSERFYETFHGTNISIQYLATVDVMRGYLHKSLSATVEFIVETDLLNPPISPEMVIFYITQDTQRHPILPELKSGGFRITGRISTQCSMLEPLSGELTVEASVLPICSIDIHLLRVESVLLGEKIITETSLIQTTQVQFFSLTIADGDVCRNMTLPIYVVLPRLLTCPTVLAGLSGHAFGNTVRCYSGRSMGQHSNDDDLCYSYGNRAGEPIGADQNFGPSGSVRPRLNDGPRVSGPNANFVNLARAKAQASLFVLVFAMRLR